MTSVIWLPDSRTFPGSRAARWLVTRGSDDDARVGTGQLFSAEGFGKNYEIDIDAFCVCPHSRRSNQLNSRTILLPCEEASAACVGFFCNTKRELYYA